MRNFSKLHPSFRKTTQKDDGLIPQPQVGSSQPITHLDVSQPRWVQNILSSSDTKINCTTSLLHLPWATALKPPASYMVSPHSAKTAQRQWSADMAHFGGVLGLGWLLWGQKLHRCSIRLWSGVWRLDQCHEFLFCSCSHSSAFFHLFFLLFSGVHCPLDGSCCHRGVLLLLGGVQRQYPRFTRRSSKVLADWCMD